MFLAELFAAPVRFRQWRKARRRWRRTAPILPPPEPGTEAAEWLAHFRRLGASPLRPRHRRSA